MAQGKYRSDIDGLRAVAVIAVLLHHLKANPQTADARIDTTGAN